MADNVEAQGGSGGAHFGTAEVSWSGDTIHMPGNFSGILSGSEGAYNFDKLVGGAGTVSDGTQRVTLANDDPAVVKLGTIDTDTSAISANTAYGAVVGGGVEATALRVTIASNSTGVVSIDDNGGAITVDGTVSAAQSGTWTVNLGAVDNAVLDVIASPVATIGATPLTRVAIFDESDSQITSFGGGTQYAVDAALGATPTGTLAIAIRDDALSSLTPAEGDAIGLRVDANGALWTTISGTVTVGSHAVTNAGTFAVQAAQSGTWNVTNISGTVSLPTGAATSANQTTIIGHVDGIETVLGTIDTDTGNIATAVQLIDNVIGTEDSAVPANVALVGGRYDSSARTLETGDIGAVALNASGHMLVEISAGAGSGGTSAADDADFTAGTTSGTPVMGVYESTPTSVTDGDLGAVGITAKRAIKATLYKEDGTEATYISATVDSVAGATDNGVPVLAVRDDALTTLTPVDGDYVPLRVSSTGALHVTGAGGGTQYAGDDALGATPTGTLALGRGSTAAPTGVTDGDAQAIWLTNTGAIVTAGSVTDDAAFAPGGGRVQVVGFLADDTTPDSVDEGDIGVPRMTLDRKVLTRIVGSTDANRLDIDASGHAQVDIAAASVSLAVTNAGTFAVQESGAALTALQLLDNVIGTEDSAVPANIALVGGRYDSSARTLETGDIGAVAVNASGHMLVEISAGAGSGGTSAADDADFTAGTTSGTPVMGVYESTPTSVTDGDLGTVGITANRHLKATLYRSDGTEATYIDAEFGAVAGATDSAVPMAAIRDDSLSALSDAEGDYVALRVNSTGALHVTGGGGGTQYNVDSAAGGTDTGNLLLAIRDDALTTLTPVDGDYVGLRVSSTGALHVTGGGGGTEYTEDVATANPIVGTATMMERDDALATLTPIEGDWAAMRCSANGALWVAVDGTVTVGSHAVTNAGTFAVQATQAGTWNVTNISGTVSLPTGAATAALQTSSEALLTAIDADTSNLSVVGGGTEAAAIRVTIANNSTGVLSVDDNGGALTVDGTVAATQSGTWNVTNVSGTVSLPTGASTAANQATIIGHVDGIETLLGTIDTNIAQIETAIDAINSSTAGANTSLSALDNVVVAHDASIAGATAISIIGFEGRATDLNPVASADATRGIATLLGKQVVMPFAIPDRTWQYASPAAVTDTSDDVVIASAGAGARNYITGIQVFNGHDTVGTEVVIKDGSTVIWRGWAEQTGGGCSATFNPPLRGTAATGVNVANITTGSATYFNLQGFIAAE